MPGLFAFRPMASMKVENIKSAAPMSSNSAAAPLVKAERGPAKFRLRQVGSKVSPLPLVPGDEITEASGKKSDVSPKNSHVLTKTSDLSSKKSEVSAKAKEASVKNVSSFSSHQRAKQVSDPIGESLKARICDSHIFFGPQRAGSPGGSSSGSEHEQKSVGLADMVNNFMEEETDRSRCNSENGTCNGIGCHDDDDVSSEVCKLLQGLSRCTSNLERNLLADVVATVKEVWNDSETVCGSGRDSGDCTRGCTRRAVMSRLRAIGYNAAVCKSRWDHSRGFPGGDYEYIDVVIDSPINGTVNGTVTAVSVNGTVVGNGKERLFVDLDFRNQFQIARPTQKFSSALQTVPTVFVGKADRLQQIVDIMTEATKKSLKIRTMHLPPWRKGEYMRAKWLSPYKRTTNEIPLSLPSPLSGHGSDARDKLREGEKVVEREGKREGESDVSLPFLPGLALSQKVDAVIYNGKLFSTETFAGHMKGNRSEHRAGGGEAGREREREVSDTVGVKRDISQVVLRNAGKEGSEGKGEEGEGEWKPPIVKPRTGGRGREVKAGLACVLKEAALSRQLKKPTNEIAQIRAASSAS